MHHTSRDTPRHGIETCREHASRPKSTPVPFRPCRPMAYWSSSPPPEAGKANSLTWFSDPRRLMPTKPRLRLRIWVETSRCLTTHEGPHSVEKSFIRAFKGWTGQSPAAFREGRTDNASPGIVHGPDACRFPDGSSAPKQPAGDHWPSQKRVLADVALSLGLWDTCPELASKRRSRTT